MLRDMPSLKFFRRNSGKNLSSLPESNENLHANPVDSSSIHLGSESGRPPLNAIPEPSQNPKSVTEQEIGPKVKIDRTPTKNKVKGLARSDVPDLPLPFRTPDKQGFASLQSRNKFGWAQKSESVSNVSVGGKSPGCSSTQSTPNKSVTKPSNPAFAPLSSSRPPLGMATRAANFNTISKGISIPSTLPVVVNTAEVPHFELKEDPSFWMDHNVQVLIRIRPLNGTERSLQGYSRCLRQESAHGIAWIGQPETRFTFDHVACETITQEMLFRVAGLPMVENCLSGYNSCMFAYGQTGSGKTYTMLGEIDELEVRPGPDRGMTPRIFEFLFARIKAEEESRKDEKLKYSCKCSFLEIYNEQITDLLDPSSTNLLIREDIKKGVYVENLTEFEVETVLDILKLLIQGAANRKVAATNMNRESSRSHSVFTCVIESQWEKDSTTNLRFARLNLVDLAGSERQKTSGAEGERLKEAANINKSLSTLGHVIMVLVDVAHGKQRHVPYRDSRLTFLLQDSLGGNSKTMIIANVSPSICCASETLSTLKFAQRAKLIQNNAVVNEDASGDVLALQHQIRLLKVELSFLKRQNVSRSLSFCSTIHGDDVGEGRDIAPVERTPGTHGNSNDLNGSTSLGSLTVSTKKLKSLETTLAGALRREKMADSATKHLEAEIEQLNRLVRQREEDTQCTKMMLRFREDKIRRMETLVDSLMPADSYLLEEKKALAEEIQLLRTRVDRNPEITRFALENIRLLDQLRRFQDFYQEGEREILLAEVSELRDQLLQFLDGNSGHDKYPNLCMESQLNNTSKELEDCRRNLNSCLEANAKLTREVGDLQAQLDDLKSAGVDPNIIIGSLRPHLPERVHEKGTEWKHKTIMKHTEEIINLQLELDVLKTILEEERVSHAEAEQRALHLNNKVEMANTSFLQISRQFEECENELKDARSLIEALESQQILSINELDELRGNFSRYEQENSILKRQLGSHLEGDLGVGFAYYEQKDQTSNCEEKGESELQKKLKKMQNALDKARRLNMKYQTNQASQTSHEQEMERVRQQVEAETAEAIVCLQEELQQQVELSNSKELEARQKLMVLEAESKELRERIDVVTRENKKLSEQVEKKDGEIRSIAKEWERLGCEIVEALSDGHCALDDAADQVEIGEQVGRLVRMIGEKEELIDELQKRLEDAQMIGRDLEWKLRSLRGATLAITEAQQQESSEKEREILHLRSELGETVSVINELEKKIKVRENQVRNAEICATVAFVIVNRLSELTEKNSIVYSNEDDLVEAREKLNQLKVGVSALNSSMDRYIERDGKPGKQDDLCDGKSEGLTTLLTIQSESKCFPCGSEELEPQTSGDNHQENMTILLLKKEIESALCSLRAVQIQMSEINDEKERIKKSGGQSLKIIESFAAQVLKLQTEMDDKEKQFEFRMLELSKKLQVVEDMVREANACCYQTKEVLALELSDAKAVAAQKTIETSGMLAKFEEAQETMKEADVMVNALMKASETAKFEIERYKKIEAALVDERESLINEVRSLKSCNALMEQQYEQLQEQFDSNLKETKSLVLALEDTFVQVQTTLMEEFKLITCDISCLKSQVVDCANVTKSWLEEIWFEIIGKDCAVSVLHLCHMGILLETVTGLNVEIGFLHHGLCESNSVIANLRENNVRAKKELESCSILKGKLLTDIKNSFDRISKKENETEKLSIKLSSFGRKISDLQMQEEIMLARSNSMGTELAILMKEMDQYNKSALVREELMRENDELRQKLDESSTLQEQIDFLIAALVAKDFELLVFASEMKQRNIALFNFHSTFEKLKEEEHNFYVRLKDLIGENLRLEGDRESLRHLVWELKKSCNRMSDLEVERDNLGAMLEEIKQELLFSAVERELGKQILMDQEVESTALKQEVRSLKEVTNIQCLDINSKCDELVLLREDSANANEQIKNLIGENLRLEGEIERHLVWELKSSNRMSDLEVERENLGAMLEEVKQELIFSAVEKEPCKQMLMDKEVESTALKQEVQSLKEVTNLQCLDINRKCDELALLREDSANANEQIKDFDHQTQLLHDEMDLLRDSITRLETSLDEKDIELSEIRGSYSVTVKALELRNWEMEILKKENERVLVDICSLQASISRLQAELDMKSAEQSEIESYNSILFNDFESKKLDMISLSEEMNTVKVKNRRLETEIGEANEARKRLLTEVQNMKTEHSRVFEDLEAKKLEFKSSSSQLHVLDRQNNDLTEEVARFKTDLESKIAELKEVQGCNREVCESLAASDEKNLELMSIIQKNENILTLLRSSVKHCLDSVPELVEAKNEKYIKFVDKMFREIFDCDEMASKFVTEAKCLEMCAKEVMSENLSLQADLLRKDEVLKGLQFDLSLLQESASNAKDQKDEIEEMVAAVELLEDDLDFKSVELEEALVRIQILESQLAQKIDAVCVMESELDKEQESLKLLSNENLNLKVNLEGLLVKKGSIAEELEEKSKLVERLEEELLEMGSSLDQMGFALQSANSDLCKVTKERDCLDAEVLVLKEQLEMAQSLADENEAIATEARQIAEARKAYAEEKEEEVKLLEKSVEELECTINVLENKVEIVKGEAERQRLQREELEMELQDVKHQMSTVHAAGSIMNVEARNVTSCGDDDLPRNLEEKVIELQEARKKIQILEKDLAEKEAEIVQCKAHISELTLHAEAQASEYKQKFKSLEAMAQQVKPEYGSSHVTTATLTKTEKNAVKPRGSGSPFKCIGLGLANQINSEKDEELSEGRLRIQELEALAATRQKEIFMLNTRLAAAESMTHDVIRDLLGVKLDMTNYASLLDNQQVQKMTDKRQCQNEESLQKEQELLKMKQQLDGFIEERAGWLDEINRRHAEMVAARVASEKLRQRDQFLTAENEMLKMENANHKKKVNELKEEVKKLSGQQNLQQRIHHHAKIKEENNSLKIQNDDLSAKFRRTETALLRARDELARYRASSGKKPYVDVDEEHRLKNKLEETEEERVQLAHTLLTLCTSILKAAGITRPVQDISPSVAEDALSQLKDRVATAEKELQDLKVKSKISGERIRLSELRQHA